MARRKRNYTLMIVSGESDGGIKRMHLSHTATQLLAFGLFFLVVSMICFVVYATITIDGYRDRETTQNEKLQELADANAALAASTNSLIAEVTQLSQTINQKISDEEAALEQKKQSSIPDGFPVSTKASYKAGKDKDTNAAMLIFDTPKGCQVLAAADGIVKSVTKDSAYGNLISIDHGNGYLTVYRCASAPLVKEGSEVGRGDILYLVDQDNVVLGYQIEEAGTMIDPETMFAAEG